MAVPPPSTKPALRRALRLARVRFEGDATAIHARLMPLLADARIVGGYVAHNGEPDILPVLLDALADGRGAGLPRVGADGGMRFMGWTADDPLAPGIAGIGEPVRGEIVAPDVVLAPLLGFDRAGRRLGLGGGHYDRWFAAHSGTRRIGVAWSVQEVDALPAEPWDVPLHAIVTERETFRP